MEGIFEKIKVTHPQSARFMKLITNHMTIKTFEETTPGKRIQIIFDSFRSLKSVYDNASDDDKQYFLTVQDDFLWVGTNVKFFWSGFYSEEAIRTGSRCQQHRYPRLLATEKLFNKIPDNIKNFKKQVQR